MITTTTTIAVHECGGGPKRSSKQRSFHIINHLLHRNCIFLLVLFIVAVVVLVQNQALKGPVFFSSSSCPSSSLSFLSHQWNFLIGNRTREEECAQRIENMTSRLRDMVTFIPLKDLQFAKRPTEGNTWFLSSISDTVEESMSQYIHFPSEATKGRLLCIAGQDKSDGTRNSYALAWPDSLPPNATLRAGLTVVSETLFDYDNLWHSLSTAVPIVGWHKWKGCVVPERLVLYHWGELRTKMGDWIQTIIEATLGRQITIEDFSDQEGRPTCFEEAVVFRHNEGSMPKEKKGEVYDMIRCRARMYCNISTAAVTLTDNEPTVRLTLLFRSGSRSFKDERAVIEIFKKECDKVDGCRLTFMIPNDMSFCDQVRLMRDTDVLVTQHGAQLTNMIFMERNSSVMELFPKGWLDFAGNGQYVFHWLADWAGMRHEGLWRDEEGGAKCPYSDTLRCFDIYKDGQLGHNETYFADWTARVLAKVKQYKLEKVANNRGTEEDACSCG